MAAVESPRKQVVAGLVSYGNIPNVRTIEYIIDFNDVEATSTLASGDHLNVMTLPKGTIVLAVGLEQIQAGVETNSTLVARVGTTTMSATLAGNAAVGTVTAAAAVNAVITTAATDINVLAATAARTSGIVRVFAVVIEGLTPQFRQIADRDVLA